MTIPKPCIQCGTPTTHGTRCTDCQQEHDHQRNARRIHYKGSYQTKAKHIRNTAAICHLCGEGPKYGDPWQADHLTPGDPNSPLLPAHRSCNASRGNQPL